jgi:uncharacterized protein
VGAVRVRPAAPDDLPAVLELWEGARPLRSPRRRRYPRTVGNRTDIFDVGRLGLSSGEARRLELDVRVDAIQFGGQTYDVSGGGVRATLDVAHTTSGYSLRLRYEARLEGACVRCLEGAGHGVTVDAREVDQPGRGEDLESPYLEDAQLDLRGWARDALVLALPAQIVCGPDCRGLCAICGENLNRAGPEHVHERAPDPRWAALRELRLE